MWTSHWRTRLSHWRYNGFQNPCAFVCVSGGSPVALLTAEQWTQELCSCPYLTSPKNYFAGWLFAFLALASIIIWIGYLNPCSLVKYATATVHKQWCLADKCWRLQPGCTHLMMMLWMMLNLAVVKWFNRFLYCTLWRYGLWRTLISLNTDFHSSLNRFLEFWIYCCNLNKRAEITQTILQSCTELHRKMNLFFCIKCAAILSLHSTGEGLVIERQITSASEMFKRSHSNRVVL
jgi:hypothetical protein